MFLRFQRDSDGLATIDAVAQGLVKAGINVTPAEIAVLVAGVGGGSCKCAISPACGAR